MWVWWCRGLPLYLDGVVFAELDAVVPQLERQVCRSKIDLDDKVDAVVLLPAVPPVTILKLKLIKRDCGKIRFYFAY